MHDLEDDLKAIEATLKDDESMGDDEFKKEHVGDGSRRVKGTDATFAC